MDASLYRYDPKALLADYARAAFGALLCLSPLVVVETGSVMVYILAGVGVVFLVFGVRTVSRHTTAVELTAGGVRCLGLRRRTLAWLDLGGMKLAYFSTRRDKRKGWMELKLTGGGTTMRFDSSLDGFDAVVAAAWQAALGNGLALSEVTRANLDAMGFAASPSALPDDHL